MKHVTKIIFLGLLTLSLNAREHDPCPYGHDAIKEIPIMYGLPEPSEELHEKIQRDEIVIGGCVVYPDSPEFVIRCTVCGIEKEGSQWILTSEDSEVFPVEIPENLQSLAKRKVFKSSVFSHVFEEDGSSFFRLRAQLPPHGDSELTPEEVGLDGDFEIIFDQENRRFFKSIDAASGLETVVAFVDAFTLVEVAPTGKNEWGQQVAAGNDR